MPKTLATLVLSTLCISLTVICSVSHAQVDQLANRIPNAANALVLVDVKSAYASPLAKSQGWDSRDLQAARSGMIALPSEANYFLMAAEIDYEFMQPLWEIAVAHVRSMPSMQTIATRSGGQLDRFAGTEAVERPNDSYVVALGPKVIGAMSPANRQNVARWVRATRSKKSPDISDYLTEVLNSKTGPKNPILIAMDLQGVVSSGEVFKNLSNQDSLAIDDNHLKSLAQTIASIRGIRLEIQLQDPPQGRLSLDFAKDAGDLRAIAKPILLHVLAKHGAEIQELEQWQVSAADQSISLGGELTDSGLRRMLSFLSSPVGPMATMPKTSTSDDEVIAVASQRYFQSVTNYLNDLFLSDRQPQSMYQIKSWVQRYANKIADLDTYQVDPDVVAFAQQVIDSLYEIVSVVDRAQKRSDIRESTMYNSGYNSGRRRYGRYGAYGYFEKSTSVRDRQLIQADEASRGLRSSQVIVDELRALSAETRQTMTERYKRPF